MSQIRTVLMRLISSRRGNVAPLAALMFPMILLMMGGAMDYIQAGRRQEALQGISDAAALAALTPAMMATTDAVATTNAKDLFAGQSGLLTGIGTLTYSTTACTTNCYYINVTDVTSGTIVIRTSVVTFNTTSSNVFTKILGFGSTIIGGSSTAKNTLAPKTNFYLMVDTSPSMEIAGSPTDIAKLQAATINENPGGCVNQKGYYEGKTTTGGVTKYVCTPLGPPVGCEFACHESDPTAYGDDWLFNPSTITCTGSGSTDMYSWTTSGFTKKGTGLGLTETAAVYNADPYTPPSPGPESNPPSPLGYGITGNYGAEDNYALARCLGLQLRIDLVNQAVTNLLELAPTTATANHTTYGAAVYTFDAYFHTLWPTAETYQSNATAFQTDMQNFSTTNGSAKAATSIAPMEVYLENYRSLSAYQNGPEDFDEDTWMDDAIANLNTIMPNPGNGTGVAGDTPQEVVFLITDAVQDYYTSPGTYSSTRNYGPLDSTGICETIKARGIRVAVLYLTYNPPDTNTNPPCASGSAITPTCSWYDMNIAPLQSQIATNAQNCASSGLYTEVNSGGDITSALENLFQLSVETAYLAK